MRVHVVSDVHGNAEALARAGDGADALVVLGDLVDFVDYHDPARGILGRVFGPEVSARFGRLRAGGRPGELRAFIREAWSRFADPAAVVEEAVREQYAALFAAMTRRPTPSPATSTCPGCGRSSPGPACASPTGGSSTIGGLRFGFVGGVPLPPGTTPRPAAGRGRPYVRAGRGVRRRGARGCGEVDVLCSHAPPAVPELAYDVVSRRPEAAVDGAARRDPPRPAAGGAVRARAPAAGARGAGSGAPSASTSGTSARPATPYVLRW